MGLMDSERKIFEGFEGIRLVADVRGDPDAWPVLFLHGGGQTRFAWGRTAEILAQEATCVLVSHDRFFVRAIGTRFLHIADERTQELEPPSG